MTARNPKSPNFGFLRVYDERLPQVGALAERYFADDPVTSLMKLRQLGELMAQELAAHMGVDVTRETSQSDLLAQLRRAGALPHDVARLFHELKNIGNEATHELRGTHQEALFHLKLAHKLAIWMHRTLQGGPTFKAGAFVPPRQPEDPAEALRAEVEQLRKLAEEQRIENEAQREAREEALRIAEAERRWREDAEERQRQLLADQAALEALLDEHAEREKVADAHLQAVQAQALANPAEIVETRERAEQAASRLDLDEAETRRLIDAQLRDAGWEVDSETLRYARGTRPQRNKHVAIAEWPTANGPVDYALFSGLTCVGLVEAKRAHIDVSAVLEQSKRYSRGYEVKGDETLPAGSPWDGYKVPFLFATNGRPFLKQIETKSGIWFRDVRRPQNLGRALGGWPSAEDLDKELEKDIDAAEAKLAERPIERLGLRGYQNDAIQAIEAAIGAGQRNILVAMATGTGKTRTCLGLCFRLLETRRFRRILFVVDRTSLGDQAQDAMAETRLEGLNTLEDTFDIKKLTDIEPDKDTRLQVATVQSLVQRVLRSESPPSVGQYDCIIVDECHRGYALDRELSDAELTFRDEADYISKYRRVLEHFDTVKIGLTATPALHTVEIFGKPVYEYSYREAVVDGYLIDHEPPLRIVTALSEDGIHWKAGERVAVLDGYTGQVDYTVLPDEVNVELPDFNKRVLTPSFNRVVCERLATHLDPADDGKTLIFCATDQHADMVVTLLKEAFAEAYGEVDDDAVKKITGKTDQPRQAIRHFKNEALPNVAVTVDLLTTGIDVPTICNLVFLRQVKSRILYEQMLGRATRRCDDIGKEVFRIFDAVELYDNLAPLTAMKPVVVDPKLSFEQLFGELTTADQEENRDEVVAQIITKLARKRRHLSEAQVEQVQTIAGRNPEQLLADLRAMPRADAARWLLDHGDLVAVLDAKSPGGRGGLYLSDHEDELRREVHGYGKAQRPEDYLSAFRALLRDNLNRLPALTVVTQRPRELTRAQLRELKRWLDQQGYTEARLRTAYRDTTNQDIAASIVGFIRQAALGDPLVPYADRVQQAIRKIEASRAWAPPQRKWLERIGKQIAQEGVVDRDALDRGQFAENGGFKRLNTIFKGELEQLLGDLNEAIWERGA